MKVTINNQLHYIQWSHVNNVGMSDRKLSMLMYAKAEPKASYTECTLKNAETKEIVAEAKAVLGKKEKHFNKNEGRKWSLRKLLSKLSLSKEEREEIWNLYFVETNQKS